MTTDIVLDDNAITITGPVQQSGGDFAAGNIVCASGQISGQLSIDQNITVRGGPSVTPVGIEHKSLQITGYEISLVTTAPSPTAPPGGPPHIFAAGASTQVDVFAALASLQASVATLEARVAQLEKAGH